MVYLRTIQLFKGLYKGLESRPGGIPPQSVDKHLSTNSCLV